MSDSGTNQDEVDKLQMKVWLDSFILSLPPKKLIKNKNVQILIKALNHSLKTDMDLKDNRLIVLNALKPWEVNNE